MSLIYIAGSRPVKIVSLDNIIRAKTSVQRLLNLLFWKVLLSLIKMAGAENAHTSVVQKGDIFYKFETLYMQE